MICKYCNTKNDDDAIFCKNCGSKIMLENLCSKCGSKNDDDARFCKQCGNTLEVAEKSKILSDKTSKKIEILKLSKFVMQIVSICFCSLIILLCFGACFSPYLFSSLTVSGELEAMGFFTFIKSLKEYELPARLYGSEFHFLSNALPNIIGLVGTSLALLGCSISLVYGLVVGIKVACKGEIPDLKKPTIFSICSLLFGYLIISLMFTSISASIYQSFDISLQGGGLVKVTLGLGLAWYLLSFVGNAVIDLIDNFEVSKLRNYIFRVGEFALLLIVLFNVSSGLIKLLQPISLVDVKVELQFSGISFLSLFSDAIYNSTQLDEYFTFEGNLAVSYYFAIVCCILLVIAIILLSIFFVLRVNKKESKSSISTGVVFFTTSLVLLIISCITVQMLKAPNGGSEFIINNFNLLGILSTDSELCQTGLSANLIVTMVFSTSLFVLEIVWNRLGAKEKSKTENQIA